MFVTIYGRPGCSYCMRAHDLAEKLRNEVAEFDYRYINMPDAGLSKEDLSKLLNLDVQTVPQILVDEKPVGGYSDFAPIMRKKFGISL